MASALAAVELDREKLQQQRARLIANSLPPKEECDALVSDFFDCVYPMCALIPRSQLWDLYNGFRTIESDPSAFCVIFSLLYGASVARNSRLRYTAAKHDQILRDDPYREQINRFQVATESALRIADFHSRPSTMSLLAATILQTCNRRQSVAAASAAVSGLIRVAQSMGLHRDPALFKSNNIRGEEGETRRRIWWHLVYLDAVVSVGNGLPTTVQQTGYDVKLASTDLKGLLDEDKCLILFNNSLASSMHALGPQLSDMYGSKGITMDTLSTLLKTLTDVKIQFSDTLKKLEKLTFEHTSQYTTRAQMLRVRDSTIVLLALSCEKGLLVTYHMNFELERREVEDRFPFSGAANAAVAAAAAATTSSSPSSAITPLSSNANLDDDGEQCRSPHRRVHFACVALRSLKLYLKLANAPDRANFSWYLSSVPQFHAMIVVLRDICSSPLRGLVASDGDLIEDVARFPTCVTSELAAMIREQDDDERLAVVEEVKRVTEFLRLNESSPFTKLQWAKMLRLLDSARQAKLNSLLERDKSSAKYGSRLDSDSSQGLSSATSIPIPDLEPVTAVAEPLTDAEIDSLLHMDIDKAVESLFGSTDNKFLSSSSADPAAGLNAVPEEASFQDLAAMSGFDFDWSVYSYST